MYLDTAPTQELREAWAYSRVIPIAEHPVYFENVSRMLAVHAPARTTNSLSAIQNLISVLIRRCSDTCIFLNLAEIYPRLFESPLVIEAMEYFFQRPGAQIRIIHQNRGCVMLENDPTKCDWKDLRPIDPRHIGPERYLVTDKYAWWRNHYGSNEFDLESRYGMRARREGVDLISEFNHRFVFA